jgi:hypothetical protein
MMELRTVGSMDCLGSEGCCFASLEPIVQGNVRIVPLCLHEPLTWHGGGLWHVFSGRMGVMDVA